ncbi:hypothetical protein [Paenibacillus sp. GD4]|uniref:hypothetical protein n=1 Tax=Paenibacillus sp. GD4 TaxID=3068890 RepID=UPI00358EE654
MSNPEETGLWDTMNLTTERTGIWNDLSSTSISSHITGTYSRLRVMAKAYATPGSSLYRNANQRKAILSELWNGCMRTATTRTAESTITGSIGNWEAR